MINKFIKHIRTTLQCILILLVFSLSGQLLAQEHSEPELIPRKTTSTSVETPQTITTATTSSEQTNKVSSPNSQDERVSISLIVMGLLIGGFILLLIEIALIPGFGIVGIKGIILIVVALVLAFWKLDGRTAAMYTFFAFIALIGLSLWFVFVFPHTRLGKRFILQTKMAPEDGYVATPDLSKFVGQEGVATSDLRPSGIARIGNDRVDVISEGDFVPKGSKIKVVRIKNANLIVTKIE